MNEYLEKIKTLLRPDLMVETINDIDFAALKERGITALIIDLDETLLPRNSSDITPQLFEWVMDRKEEGFGICLTSNSRHPIRVKYIGETLKLPTISFGLKPLPFAFQRSLAILKAKPEETAMIGDQLFMDILGANLVGIFSIFVKYRTPETFFLRRWMRQAESWVLSNLDSSAPA